MLSAVLGRADLEPDAAGGHGLVLTAVRTEDTVGVRGEDVEHVIDIVRTASEADVAVVLKQLAPEEWTVSLRSAGRVDVGRVAIGLGGGGHVLAAGLTTSGTEDEVAERIRRAVADVAVSS
jgi:phosphoesterase RecJ-like protein